MAKGRFITLEGIEGAGKTTQAVLLQDYLKDTGRQVVLTREPGGTTLGEAIRDLLLEHRDEGMVVESELLLLFAARAEHIQRVIQPAMARGQWVVCDRFTDASYAYQGGGRRIPWERIATLENWLQGTLRPDLTLLFDLPVREGLARAGRRGLNDRFESEDITFFERVRQAYLDLARRESGRYRIIDAQRPVAEVRAEVEGIVRTLLV